MRKSRPRKGKKPSKESVARMVALSELGKTPYEIEKITGHSHNTIAKYLEDQEAYIDPKMQERVIQIKEKEILDLTVLNVEAKRRLHKIVPRANVIESLAVMDRTFQQIRLLEGKSTQNIATLTKIIQEAHNNEHGPYKREIEEEKNAI